MNIAELGAMSWECYSPKINPIFIVRIFGHTSASEVAEIVYDNSLQLLDKNNQSL